MASLSNRIKNKLNLLWPLTKCSDEYELLKVVYTKKIVDVYDHHGCISDELLLPWYSLENWKRRQFTEKVYCNKETVWIEPIHGWAINSKGAVLINSISLGYACKTPLPDRWPFLRRKSKIELKEAVTINFAHRGGYNYYHFFSDLLAQLNLVIETSGKKDMPIIISEKLANQPFFQQTLQRSEFLNSFTWIVQKDKWIRVNELWYAINANDQKIHYDIILKWLNVLPKKLRKNKIFLTRGSNRSRRLENETEIFGIAKKYGFEKVDTDLLTLDEQIEVFSSVSAIVGIHGAAFMNMIFAMGYPVKIMEIFFAPYHVSCYYNMAQHCHFQYAAICGETMNANGSFFLNPEKFEKYFLMLLKNDPVYLE